MKLQPLEEGPQRVKQQANAGGTAPFYKLDGGTQKGCPCLDSLSL